MSAEPTVNDHREAARVAVSAFERAEELSPVIRASARLDDEPQAVIVDLLASLRHLADEEGVDWATAERIAYETHYRNEKEN